MDNVEPGSTLERARAARRAGDLERAIAEVLQGLRSTPDSMDLHIERAAILMASARFREAVEAWRAMIQRFGDAVPTGARVRLANALRKDGRGGEAASVIDAVLDGEPDHLEALLEAAQISSARGETATAVAMLTRAERIASPHDDRARLALARMGAAPVPSLVPRSGSRAKDLATDLGVCVAIAPGDSMHHGSDEQYFEVGASALQVIRRALAVVGRGSQDVRSILDYACGYGRVARWMRAGFSTARMLAVDADAAAVASIRAGLGIEARTADLSMANDLGDRFDLIWMGSLVTHLDRNGCRSVLAYLARHLACDGVLVATMHGPYVAARIRAGEKLYGLEGEAVRALLADYDESGYGYGDYPRQMGYGISAATEESMRQINAEAGLQLVAYWPREWAHHQDVYLLRQTE